MAAPGFDILLLVLAAALGLFSIFVRSRNVKSQQLPPGPQGLPILGYLPFLGDNLQSKFAELADAYGPIYKLWLGKKLYIVVSSPVLVKEIVRDQDHNFSHRRPNIASYVMTYGGKDIAFSDYGPYWRSMRKFFIREIMSARSLNACYDLRRQAVGRSVAEVYRMTGMPVDIGVHALRTIINVVMAMLWGGSLGVEKSESFDSEFKMVIAKLQELQGKPNISDFFPVLSRFDLQGVEREAREVNIWFDQFLDSVIKSVEEEERRRSPSVREEKKNLLQLLLELQIENKDDSPTMSANNQEIKGILMDIVVGGNDTTATMVEWTMAELLKHRNVLRKVMEELIEVVGMDSMVEERHLPNLKYLEAVVKETSRLHTALPLLVARTPDTTCIVGGYTIPEGSMVFLNAAYIHTDPKYWDNPSKFFPERFLKDPNEYGFSGNNFKYMPFGSGRRICAGLALAEKMLMLLLANLLHCFEWELPNGTELEFSYVLGIVAKKKMPLVAIPKPRLVNQDLYM